MGVVACSTYGFYGANLFLTEHGSLEGIRYWETSTLGRIVAGREPSELDLPLWGKMYTLNRRSYSLKLSYGCINMNYRIKISNICGEFVRR